MTVGTDGVPRLYGRTYVEVDIVMEIFDNRLGGLGLKNFGPRFIKEKISKVSFPCFEVEF